MKLKILLILIFVLGLTSAANANLLISVDGVTDPPDTEVILTPSEEVILDIMGDDRPQPADFFLVPDAYSQIGGGVMLYQGDQSEIVTYYPGHPIIDWLNENGFPDATHVIYMKFAHSAPMPLTGKLVDEILFHCVAPGDSVLTLVSSDLNVVEDIQIIHQVPEPTTICLLALGGLALMRKRRA